MTETVWDLRRYWNEKTVEPVKRNKDGLRWVIHRFPIKGGISRRQSMIEDMSAPNPILRMMQARNNG